MFSLIRTNQRSVVHRNHKYIWIMFIPWEKGHGQFHIVIEGSFQLLHSWLHNEFLNIVMGLYYCCHNLYIVI